MEQLLERFIVWAKTNPDIRGAYIVGSRARVDRPADVWSDLDIVIVTTDPERYLTGTDWLEHIGPIWLTFLERIATGDEVERRVLFEGARDVDFIPISVDAIQRAIQSGFSDLDADIARRGIRVVLDKDGLLDQITSGFVECSFPQPPVEAEFLELVNDFWYHAVWTAKKLRRGELWTAKSCCDLYMKRLLLRMMEWHARATHGWDYDTWFNGRFLEQWAAPSVLEKLHDTFAHYDRDDVGRALLATMETFWCLALTTARRLNYVYPSTADERVTDWVTTCLSEPGAHVIGESS